jgi:RimJ/RimL family protein N-acetyltransferase
MLSHAVADPQKSTIVRPENVGYPRELERRVTVRDGARVRIRPIRPEDESRLVALFERLSARTVYHRFFTSYRRLPPEWYREFANVDYQARLALVAEHVTADAVHIRGVARWEPGDEPDTVEIALVVEDAWQGRGLGTALLDALLDAARGRGIHRFSADVLAENERMLRLLRKAMVIEESTASHGVVHLALVA